MLQPFVQLTTPMWVHLAPDSDDTLLLLGHDSAGRSSCSAPGMKGSGVVGLAGKMPGLFGGLPTRLL